MSVAVMRTSSNILGPVRAAAIALIAVSLGYAAYSYWRAPVPVAADPGFPAIVIPEEPGNRSWDEVVARFDRSIVVRTGRVAANPDDWGVLESLASAYVDRGRLTGNYGDFRRADALFAQAFAVAAPGTGPFMTRARFDFLMHRLGRAEDGASATEGFAIPVRGQERAEVLGLRGDIALYRGGYDRALALYETADAEHRTLTNAYRFFAYYSALGDQGQAAQYFRQLSQAPMGDEEESTLARIRGIYHLRLGQYDLASASFGRADRLFPGDWRNTAMLAQMAALRGDTAGAIEIFERVARERHSPEAMDALAALYRYEGDALQSIAWADRAGAIWAERLRAFPEATYAHALDHELAFGSPKRALELARANWRARPYGATAIGLSWALMANGRLAEARRTIEAVLESPWESAELHAAASRIYALSGDSEAAGEQRERALAINPHVLDANSVLIWFGH